MAIVAADVIHVSKSETVKECNHKTLLRSIHCDFVCAVNLMVWSLSIM